MNLPDLAAVATATPEQIAAEEIKQLREVFTDLVKDGEARINLAEVLKLGIGGAEGPSIPPRVLLTEMLAGWERLNLSAEELRQALGLVLVTQWLPPLPQLREMVEKGEASRIIQRPNPFAKEK